MYEKRNTGRIAHPSRGRTSSSFRLSAFSLLLLSLRRLQHLLVLVAPPAINHRRTLLLHFHVAGIATMDGLGWFANPHDVRVVVEWEWLVPTLLSIGPLKFVNVYELTLQENLLWRSAEDC